MSHRYSSSCIFSSDKISRWQYFIVSPNYVQENEKMLKNDIFQSFSFISVALKIFGEILKNRQSFSSCSSPRTTGNGTVRTKYVNAK